MTEHHGTADIGIPSWIWVTGLVALVGLYLGARLSLRRGRDWPWYRSLLWCLGVVIAGAAVVGPIADRGRLDLRWHMGGHLLLGMLAPILLVLGAPITLALRALPVVWARRLVRLLASPVARGLAHPISAAVLNSAGLYLLYTTDLYALMHRSAAFHLFVQVHTLLAGYLFTAAIIGIDPVRHRASWTVRAVALIGAMAAHAILAKSLYGQPPVGVIDARSASQLMYYGGDLVDGLLILIFCRQWFRAAQPRPVALRPVEATT